MTVGMLEIKVKAMWARVGRTLMATICTALPCTSFGFEIGTHAGITWSAYQHSQLGISDGDLNRAL
jgi:hypothetical protein